MIVYVVMRHAEYWAGGSTIKAVFATRAMADAYCATATEVDTGAEYDVREWEVRS